MDVIVLDPKEQARLIQQRRDARSDHHDEVWDGDYVLTPLPDNEHQEILWNLTLGFRRMVEARGHGAARPGANITDQVDDWERNYRCCDVVVHTRETIARVREDHCLGGPDFIVEIVSRHDRSRRKIDFYGKVGVRELLLVDRYPWALELYRLGAAGTLELAGTSMVGKPGALSSRVLPVSFRLEPGEERPQIVVEHADGLPTWSA